MTPLDDFWKFIWLRPGLDASGAEWRVCLGDTPWQRLRGPLFAGDGMAPVCRRMADGRVLRVVVSAGGSRLVCGATGTVEAADVPTEDLRRYRLDASAIRQALAQALGISVEPGLARAGPGAVALGQWQAKQEASVAVFLMFPPTMRLLVCEIQRLLLAVAEGFILLIPQRPHLDARMRDQLDRRRASVIALSEAVMWSGTCFCAAEGWDRHRHAYATKYLGGHLVPAAAPYQFARRGMWAIRFAGRETFLEGDLKGPVFIRYLLVNQGQRIHAARMLADIAGDERLAQASDAGDAITAQEITHYRTRYDQLQEAKQEAVQWNDEGRLVEIEQELGQMAAHMGPLFGLGGRSRKANDDVARIRKAIARVIGLAVEKMAACDPELAQHLRRSIKTHTYMSYEPENPIDWVLE